MFEKKYVIGFVALVAVSVGSYAASAQEVDEAVRRMCMLIGYANPLLSSQPGQPLPQRPGYGSLRPSTPKSPSDQWAEDERPRREICKIVVRQGLLKQNSVYLERLHDAVGKCDGSTAPDLRNQQTKEKIFGTVNIDTIADADRATIVRWLANCQMKLAGQDSLSSLGYAVDRNIIALDDAILSEKRVAENRRIQLEAQETARAQAQAEASRRESHIEELRRSGYEFMSSDMMMVDAKKFDGKKVATRGLVNIMTPEIAMLYKNNVDINGVALSYADASRKTRYYLISRCGKISRACSMEVRGLLRVVNGTPVIMLE